MAETTREPEKPVPDVCPFCFAEGTILVKSVALRWVSCRNRSCRAEGPMCDTEDEAVARWNAVPRNRPMLQWVDADGKELRGVFRDRDLPPPVADRPLLPLLAVYANRDGLCHTVLAGSAEDRIALGLEYNLVGHLLLVNKMSSAKVPADG